MELGQDVTKLQQLENQYLLALHSLILGVLISNAFWECLVEIFSSIVTTFNLL